MRNQFCKLSLLTEADFDDMLTMFGEPNTFEYIPKLRSQSQEFYRSFLSDSMDQIKKGDKYYWMMRDPDDGEFIGAINLGKFPNSDVMQIGWQICEAFQQQGMAYMGAQMALDFAINETDISTICGRFEAENIASDRILNKLRFSLEKIEAENKTQIHHYIFNISR